MRLPCHLRDIRGDRSLAEIMDAVPPKTGLSKGLLSQLEHGRWLPTDQQRELLEQAYGAPASLWWPAEILLAIQADEP